MNGVDFNYDFLIDDTANSIKPTKYSINVVELHLINNWD